MYSRILVPLDGSPLAEAVLPYAQVLAQGLKLPVTLLEAVESPDLGTAAEGEHGFYLGAMIEGLVARAKTYLEQTATRLRNAGIEVTPLVFEGTAAARIVAEAEQNPSTLIAMSSHGRSGLTRWVLGSVADKVLHATASPLLIIHSRDQEAPSASVPLQHLIVPLDGSPLAEQILPHASDLAKALHLAVILVRVTPTAASYYAYGPDYVYPGIPVYNPGDLQEAVDENAESYLARTARLIREQAPAAGAVETRLLHGDAAGAIMDLARETPGCLIAMTTHGRSGVGRWVLGSIADRVVRTSGDPVLLIRAAAPDAKASA